MTIALHLRTIKTILVVVFSFVVLAGFCAELARPRLGNDAMLVQWFSLSEEANVPTWWSSTLLLAGSLAAAAIAAVKKEAGKTRPEAARYRRHWIGLSLIFLYMSIDEAIQIHEWLSETKVLRGWHGFLYFSWVVPVSVLVVIFAISYLRFLAHLPPKIRSRVALSGILYVGGALGVELILGKYADVHGTSNLGYAMIDMVEESLEMIGASLFLVTLLDYLGSLGELRLSIRSSE